MPATLRAAAEAAKGFMPPDEGLALYEAAYAAADRGPILEVGTYCGKSALYLGAAAAARGGVVVTLDHHRGSEEQQAGWEHHDPEVVDATGRMDTLPFARRTIAAAGLEDAVVMVVGRSVQVAALWRTPLGALFIDGGHAEDVARADYEAWVGHVAPGGLLLIHDVFPDPADGGQAPYQLYLRALGEGFVERSVTGSLRVLERVAHGG